MKVSKTFKALIPPLTKDEYQGLEADIIANGCRVPLDVWREKDILVDGHHRHAICTKNSIGYKVNYVSFSCEDDAKVWAIRNQFNRRNINSFQRAELALELKPLIAKEAKKQQGERTDISTSLPKSAPIDTRKTLAKTAGVSEGTINKVETIKKHATKEVKDALRKGDVSINKVYNEVKPSSVKDVKTKTIHKDKLGNAIEDESLQVAFENARELDGVRRELVALKNKLKSLCNAKGGYHLSDKDVTREINCVSRTILFATPYCLVPPSSDAQQWIRDIGFMTKQQYDSLPENKKSFRVETD